MLKSFIEKVEELWHGKEYFHKPKGEIVVLWQVMYLL